MPQLRPPMPFDEGFYEFIDGRWVQTPTSTCYAAMIWSRLGGYLGMHLDRPSVFLGHLVMQVLFRLPLSADPTRERRPDVAFVSSDRWPIDRPMSPVDDAWPVVPDLVAEVVSPADRAEELLSKVEEYFRVGVRLVWVVYPIERCIHVHESPNRMRVVTEADELDGGEALPGFRQRLDRLFGPVVTEKTAGA